MFKVYEFWMLWAYNCTSNLNEQFKCLCEMVDPVSDIRFCFYSNELLLQIATIYFEFSNIDTYYHNL